MARFSDTQEISFGDLKPSRSLIVNGSVTVAAFDGVDWVNADTLATGVYQYYTNGLRLRFTPTAGSSFEIATE